MRKREGGEQRLFKEKGRKEEKKGALQKTYGKWNFDIKIQNLEFPSNFLKKWHRSMKDQKKGVGV